MELLAGSVLPRRQIPAGTAVYRQGDQVRALFVSQGGVLKTETLGVDGQAQVIGFHFPGELIGVEAFDSGRFRASALALEPASVCEIPIAALERVASQDPSFQRQLMRAAGSCLAHQQDHIELLSLRQADERIALFLVGMLERTEAATRAEQTLIHLPMNRSDIASYLCLNNETVSRSFSRLRDDGVLGVNGRHVRVLDRGRLARIAKVSDMEQPRLA